MGFQQGFRINTNTSSLDTYRNYSASQAGMERNIERLSSGLRINKAADDSAGLSISNRMDNQVRGMQQANRNVQQGNNMLQTAEGGLNEISNILGRMRELTVQGASDGVNSDDRASIKLEIGQLSAEITRIADSTEYNDTKVLGGDLKSTFDTTASDANITNVEAAVNVSGSVDANGNLTGTNNTKSGTYTLSVHDTSNSGARIDNGEIDVGDIVRLTDQDGNTYDHELVTGDSTFDASGSSDTIASGKTLTFGNSGITLTISTAAVDLTDLSGISATDGKKVVVTDGTTLQVGADNHANNQITFSLGHQDADKLGVSSGDLGLGSDAASYQSAITKLDNAINEINNERGNIGAKQNRLEFTSSNLMNSVQNNAASMSTIRDADFAAEAADLAKNQILVQSGTAMLAQANGLSQNVLALIR
jgi:flagellin